MAKRPASLEAALGNKPQPEPISTADIVQHPTNAASTKPAEEKITGYVPLAAKKRLELMCIEHDRDINSYMCEGLDLVFEKYGQPSLAELPKSKRLTVYCLR